MKEKIKIYTSPSKPEKM